MTLIAGFSINKQPLLLGDILLSADVPDIAAGRLPTIGDSAKAIPHGSRHSIIGVRQKVNVINDNLVVAWAGSAWTALEWLKKLRLEASRGSFTIEDLGEFFERFAKSKDRDATKFIGAMLNGKQFLSFTIGGKRVQTKFFGEVLMGGTGGSDTENLLDDVIMPADLNPAAMPHPKVEVMSSVLVVVAQLLQREMDTLASLHQRYGAGYEIATLIDGRMQKVRDVTYLFWEADARDGNVKLRRTLLCGKTRLSE